MGAERVDPTDGFMAGHPRPVDWKCTLHGTGIGMAYAATRISPSPGSRTGFRTNSILVTWRPALLILLMARWQARDRKIHGPRSP
jgi:hypothetical protein